MRKKLMLAASLLAIFASAQAQAQDVADGANTDPGEIIVTAERREQSLQKLPTTASAVTGEALADQQIQRVDDLIKTTPGLAVNDFGLGKAINIRGIGKGVEAPGVSAGVAYYVDGVPVPNGIFLETPFFDLARVEVLRGPQGTLVGMNSTGGAMLIISNNPNPDAVEGMAELSYGNFENVRARGAINLPLGGGLGLRLAGEYESRDSFFTNLGPATGKPGNVDRLSLRGAIGGELAPGVELYIRGEYNRNKTDGQTGEPIPGDPDTTMPYPIFGNFYPAAPFELARDVVTKKDTEYYRVSGELRIDVADAFQLRSVTGFQKGTVNFVNDLDGTRLPTRRQQIDISEPVFTQEINLISNPGDTFDWVLGGFYLTQTTNGYIEVKHPITQARSVEVFGKAETRNWGLFGQGTYHISDRLNATLGLRYNSEKHFTGLIADGKYIQTYDAAGLPGARLPLSISTAKDEAVTGRFTLDYEASADHFLYATVSRGFKGGGNNNFDNFKAETIWNYEAGLKSSFLGRQIRTQFGVFYLDYNNLQSQVYNPLTTQSTIQNFASAKVYGFELQAQGRFGGLTLNSSVGYTKSELGTASGIDDRYNKTAVVNLTGRSLPFSPEWTFSAGAEYDIQLGGDFSLTPRVQYSYVASQWANQFQVRPTDFIGSRNVVDASLTLTQADKGWRVEAYATNLFDETYIVSKATYASGQPGRVQYFGAPRQYGLRIGYDF